MQATKLLLTGLSCCAVLSGAAAAESRSPAPAALATADAKAGPPADGVSASTNAPPKLKVEFRNDSGPHVIPARRAYISVGRERFTFLLPGELRVESAQADQLSLVNDDLSCVLKLRVLPQSADGRGLMPEALRQSLLQRQPGSQVLMEFSMAASGSSGPAFDLAYTCRGVQRQERVTFLSFGGQTLEFSLVTSPDKAGPGWANLNFVMQTFRASDPSGKLEIVPLSDKL